MLGFLKRLLARSVPAHLRTGEWGEAQAERFLQSRGYRILGRRVRFGSHDELDLVARRGETLVFIEVKTRANEDYGRGFDAVDRAKRRTLSRAAMKYLRRLREKPRFIRFDVVEVIGSPEAGEPEIRLIENAFELDRRTRLSW